MAKSRSRRPCLPGSKKFAKRVNGKCIRFGDPNMTIKKNNPARKRSFCARHRCSQKRDKATPGYQSCKKWSCPGMHAYSRKKSPKRRRSAKRSAKRSPKRSPKRSRRRSSKRRSAKRSPKRRSPKRSPKRSRKRSPKRSRCWRGYEPVPGKKAYSKGSCRKIRR